MVERATSAGDVGITRVVHTPVHTRLRGRVGGSARNGSPRCPSSCRFGDRVRSRKLASPHVHQVLAVRLEFVAPREHLLREPPRVANSQSRGGEGVGLGRESLACPGAVRVVPGDVHDGVVEPSVEIWLASYLRIEEREP